jgi:molybdenum cofactor synthesis domain-containing protein
LADEGQVDLILTTGGTGLGPRDSTPEATQAIAEKLIPGMAEEMRRKGLEHTPRAILSRGIAAIRGTTLILNLPGSPKGAVESLDAVATLLPHSIQIIHGARHD